jgi:uncharacterized membrane protein YhhN
MKKNYWFIAFLAAVAGELTGVVTENQLLQYVFKPLLMVTLAMYFIASTSSLQHPFKRFVLLALFFSWLGDIFLIFQKDDNPFFILGLGSFLIAQIFYIIFFHKVKTLENIKSRIWPLVIVVIYYFLLIYLLSPYLGDMRVPVRVYGAVISLMLMVAIHMSFLKNRKAGLLLAFGALLFVISDSILAIDKFYQALGAAGFLVMITYVAAQFILVEGAARHILGRRDNFDDLDNK